MERGLDPLDSRRQKLSEQKERASEGKSAGNDFEAFSKRWVRERLTTKSETYRKQVESRLERFIWPAIGTRALNVVRPADVLEIIEARRETPKTAEGVRAIIQQIYNYAIQKLLVEVNPALPLRGVIEVPPAERMKMKQPHRVYLSRQAVELLTLLKALGSEPQAYVFPSILRSSVPLGEATLNHFFKRLDFGVTDFSPHGTRGTAATLLREHGFSRDVVELLLAHAERNKVTAAYHHHEMAEERRRALQYLADQIERLAAATAATASAEPPTASR